MWNLKVKIILNTSGRGTKDPKVGGLPEPSARVSLSSLFCPTHVWLILIVASVLRVVFLFLCLIK